MIYLILIPLVRATELFESYEQVREINPNETHTFLIPILSPLTQYEVRISYLGTMGTSFSIDWNCPKSPTYRLLDVEKLVFWTDGKGYPEHLPCNTQNIKVKMVRNSRAKNPTDIHSKVAYAIKLEKYTLGLPSSVMMMLPIFIFIFFVMLFLWKYLKSPHLKED